MVPGVENGLPSHSRSHGDRTGIVVELQMPRSVGIGGEYELTAAFRGKARELPIEVLSTGKAVDFNRDAFVRTRRKHLLPSCPKAGAVMKVAASRVAEDVNLRRRDRAQQPLSLIAIRVEASMNGSNHTVDLETLTSRYIQRSVLKDLDLKTLEEEEIILLLAIPTGHPAPLHPNSLSIQSRGYLEASRVVRDHRPPHTSLLTRPRHALETRLAVGVRSVPMHRSAHPIRVKLFRTRRQNLHHIGSRKEPLSGRPSARWVSGGQTLDRRLKSALSLAGDKL